MTYPGGEGSAAKVVCPACGRRVSPLHADAPDAFCMKSHDDASNGVGKLRAIAAGIGQTLTPAEAKAVLDWYAKRIREADRG